MSFVECDRSDEAAVNVYLVVTQLAGGGQRVQVNTESFNCLEAEDMFTSMCLAYDSVAVIMFPL